MKKCSKLIVCISVFFILSVIISTFVIKETFFRNPDITLTNPKEFVYEVKKTIELRVDLEYIPNKYQALKRLNDKKDYYHDKDGKEFLRNKDGHVYPLFRRYKEKNDFKKEVNATIEKLEKLYELCKSKNINFLYALAPEKTYGVTFDYGQENQETEKFDEYLELIKQSELPYFSYTDKMKEENLDIRELFFKTDHHWKPETGIWATQKLCEELNERYGFEYDKEKLNIENYKVKTLKKHFGGTYYKDSIFFNLKRDDFSLITPKFETDLTVKEILNDYEKRGKFSETVVNNKKKSHKNIYAYYSNGDVTNQEMKNNLGGNGNTVMLIRVSYACVVSPFLALQVSDLYNYDLRLENKVNIYDEINNINPDYVVILYNGARVNSSHEFDFNRKVS